MNRAGPAFRAGLRKAALSGNYARGLETGAGLGSAVASLVAHELPLSSLNDYLPQIQKVTAPQIQRFAAKNLGPGEASIVIVGDGRQFLPELQKRFSKAEVIPVDKRDLNKAALVKASQLSRRQQDELYLGRRAKRGRAAHGCVSLGRPVPLDVTVSNVLRDTPTIRSRGGAVGLISTGWRVRDRSEASQYP